MKKNKNELPPEEPYTGKAYAYIAIGLTAAAIVAFGLTFTVLGIYSLISSVLLSLASLAFVTTQKRKNNFDKLIYITVCAYIVLGVTVLSFIGGIIYVAVNY